MLTKQQLTDYIQKVQNVIDILPDIDRNISSSSVSDTAPGLSFLLYDLKKLLSLDNE